MLQVGRYNSGIKVGHIFQNKPMGIGLLCLSLCAFGEVSIRIQPRLPCNLVYTYVRMVRPLRPFPPLSDVAQMGHAIEVMTAAMQQQSATLVHQHQTTLVQPEATRVTAQAAQATIPLEFQGLAKFRKNDPSQFSGDSNLDIVDHWIRELEKIFRAIARPENIKVTYAIYLLTNEAEFWWQGTQQMMEAHEELFTQGNFKQRFMEKYFSDSARYSKEVEFMKLEQGNMIVHEYATKFEHLPCFYSLATIEAWKCRKFEV